MSESNKKQASAIMLKAQELFRLIDAFSQTVNEEDILQTQRIQMMQEDAFAKARRT